MIGSGNKVVLSEHDRKLVRISLRKAKRRICLHRNCFCKKFMRRWRRRRALWGASWDWARWRARAVMAIVSCGLGRGRAIFTSVAKFHKHSLQKLQFKRKLLYKSNPRLLQPMRHPLITHSPQRLRSRIFQHLHPRRQRAFHVVEPI